ncbi:MAG: hypothetical protein CMH13_12420 [Martelella sp.]|uniref:GcrA family cell cycle regulator n=1 Tax=unclassified Martelella TaxID=2629616 RepID=UPI000C3DB1F0|nr:hypothetical protein [Martelella sp.]
MEAGSCRWPIGDPRSPDFRLCGAPTEPGQPSCATCQKKTHQAVSHPPPAKGEQKRPAALLWEFQGSLQIGSGCGTAGGCVGRLFKETGTNLSPDALTASLLQTVTGRVEWLSRYAFAFCTKGNIKYYRQSR